MSKQAPLIEWYVAEDDTEWERLCRPSLPNSPTSTTPKHVLWYVTGVLLCCLSVVGWWVYSYRLQPDQSAIAPELYTTAETDARICTDGDDVVAGNLIGCALELVPDSNQVTTQRSGTTSLGQLADRQALAEYQATLEGFGQFTQQGDEGQTRAAQFNR